MKRDRFLRHFYSCRQHAGGAVSKVILRKLKGNNERWWLTKYEVGAKPNPPKKPIRSPKNGKVTPMNRVNAAKIQQVTISRDINRVLI